MINYKKDYIIYKSYVDGLLSNSYIKSIDNKIFCHIKAILNLAFYKSIDKNTIIITIDGTDIINDTISETTMPLNLIDILNDYEFITKDDFLNACKNIDCKK